MSAPLVVDGLDIRIRPAAGRRLFHFDVRLGEAWLDWGDPIHGRPSDPGVHVQIADYAHVAIRDAGKGTAS